ncbi:hypothetical protein B0H14DRAFT_1233170 [Mycena olivaceomarginata]|nr:hypothetical protein B0H14DRAFT_1233170 [Mycena olivaceomarginata]
MNDISTCGNVYQDGVERGLAGFRVGVRWPGGVRAPIATSTSSFLSFDSCEAGATRLDSDSMTDLFITMLSSPPSLHYRSPSLPPLSPLLRAMLTELSFPTGFISASVSAPIALCSGAFPLCFHFRSHSLLCFRLHSLHMYSFSCPTYTPSRVLARYLPASPFFF